MLDLNVYNNDLFQEYKLQNFVSLALPITNRIIHHPLYLLSHP